MQDVLEEDDVGSFVQLRSCCVHTRLVRVRDDLYLVRQLDECYVPVDKTACLFVCGLPHSFSVRVNTLAVMGVVWLVLTRLDLSRPASSTSVSRSFLAGESPGIRKEMLRV